MGHILGLEERRVARYVLLNSAKPNPGSLFGDVLNLDPKYLKKPVIEIRGRVLDRHRVASLFLGNAVNQSIN